MRSPFSQDMVSNPSITVQEFSGLGIQVEGTITAGKITFEGTLSGRKAVTIPFQDAHTNLGVPADTGVLAEGIYLIAVGCLQRVKVIFSEDFAYTGPLYVSGYTCNTLPPPYVLSGN